MDGSLFKKYEQRIQKNKTEKEELLRYIEEKTDVLLLEGEVVIDGKKIKIQTSSIKKTFLKKNNIELFLKEKGYQLSH